MGYTKDKAIEIINDIINRSHWRRQFAMMAYIGVMTIVACMVITGAQRHETNRVLARLHKAKHSTYDIRGEIGASRNEAIKGHN